MSDAKMSAPDAKSSISRAQSYQEMGAFWDIHSLADVWDKTEPTEFVVDIRPDAVYFPLELRLSEVVRGIAQSRGIPAEDLLSQWVRDKAAEVLTVGAAEE